MTMTENLVMSADWVPGPVQGAWTYAHYAALPDDGHRYEIVDGVLFMSPAPGGAHQDSTLRLAYYLLMHVEFAGVGKVRLSPFDVELSPQDVVQPDVLVVLNAHEERVTERKIIGAPDLVVKVASPGTAAYDRSTKYERYARADVPEYWIVNVQKRTVEVLVLEAGTYYSLGIFQGQQTLPSRIIPHLPVCVEQFFS